MDPSLLGGYPVDHITGITPWNITQDVSSGLSCSSGVEEKETTTVLPWIPDFTTVPLLMSDPACAKWLCQCPSRPGPPRPSCLPAGWAKMMLGSLRFMGVGLVPDPVGLPFPEAERRANFRPGGEGLVGEDVVRTGPWMGQEAEGMWTWW